jgi:2-hydroxychromene-2-carboxylate isomerase
LQLSCVAQPAGRIGIEAMSADIDFYFDFSSPYGYFAAQRIDALAARHDAVARWRPMLLGAVYKQTGGAPLVDLPLKGAYSRRDIERSARFHAMTGFRIPSRFPIPTQAAGRLFTWLSGAQPARAVPIAKALYHAYFVDDRDISDPEVTADVAAASGIARADARAAIDTPEVKDAFRREVDAAIARGVFGSPYVVVDGEPFWGFDRFDQVDRWLSTGGF